MKKYGVLLAIVMLILASLACQTIMGGGSSPSPIDNGGSDAVPTSDGGGGDSVTVGGDSQFPTPGDAFNLVNAGDTITLQTKLSAEEVIKFYRDEFGKQGYKEDTSLAVTFGDSFTLAFTGHDSGKVIYVAGGAVGDGSISVTITLQ